MRKYQLSIEVYLDELSVCTIGERVIKVHDYMALRSPFSFHWGDCYVALFDSEKVGLSRHNAAPIECV
jgi:hypothetical protein